MNKEELKTISKNISDYLNDPRKPPDIKKNAGVRTGKSILQPKIEKRIRLNPINITVFK